MINLWQILAELEKRKEMENIEENEAACTQYTPTRAIYSNYSEENVNLFERSI